MTDCTISVRKLKSYELVLTWALVRNSSGTSQRLGALPVHTLINQISLPSCQKVVTYFSVVRKLWLWLSKDTVCCFIPPHLECIAISSPLRLGHPTRGIALAVMGCLLGIYGIRTSMDLKQPERQWPWPVMLGLQKLSPSMSLFLHPQQMHNGLHRLPVAEEQHPIGRYPISQHFNTLCSCTGGTRRSN